MYEITLAGSTVLDIALSNYGTRDLNVLLLSSCDACDCIAVGPAISETVPAGTYTIVVDGYTSGDDGSFDIDITCTDPCDTLPVVNCGDTVSGDTSDDTDDFHPPCGTSGGKDEMWKLVYNGPIGSNINISVPSPGWDHVVYILSDCTDENSCTHYSDPGTIDVTTTSSPQTFFIVIDGYGTGSGTYDLTVSCSANTLDCGSPIPLACGSTVSVDTSTGNENVASYNCDPGNYYYGPEVVYEFTTPAAGDITATLSNLAGDDLDIFILDACDPDSCVAYGNTTASYPAATAGTYLLVIDSDKAGSSGTADLTITCPLANNLNCAGAVDITCNTELDGDTTTGLAGQARYGCGVRDLQGRELIYHLDLTGNTDPVYLLASLSNTGTRDLDLVLLDGCNPNFCVLHEDSQITYLADPGDYYLIVDGLAAQDNGTFHLEVLCSAPSTLSCGGGLCDPGYEPILEENFEGTWGTYGDNPPAGWSIEDNAGGSSWDYNDWHRWSNGAPQNYVARVYYTPIENQDEELITPVLDCSSYTSVILKFWHYYDDIGAGGDTADVDLSKNGGGNFNTNVATFDADVLGTTESYDISSDAAGDNNIVLRWRYYNANNDWYWKVDDVAVCGSPSSSAHLSCPGTDTIACGDTLTGEKMGSANNQQEYGCSDYTFSANEMVYRFTISQVQTVNITLSNFGDEDLAVFLLSACDPCACIEGGGTSISAYALSPGTYYIVVEGFDASENDAVFDISMSCNDPCISIPVISCNTPVSGDTSNDTNVINPSCGSGAGPEEIWKLVFDGPVGSTLVISMPTPGFDHVLYVLDNCADGTSCTDWVDSGNITLVTTTSPQTYYIVVDGYSSSASGTYSNLLVTCPIPNNIDCGAATPVSCGDTINGDTIGLPNDGVEYAGVNGTFNGSDIVYALTIASPTNLDFYLENHPGRSQFLFLLEVDTCNVNNVIEGGVQEIHLDNAPAGTYYLIVDGRTPFDNGTYDLRIVCNTPLTPSCSSNCTATIFSEDFSGGLPVSWTVDHNGDCSGPAETWTDANPGLRTATLPVTTPFMICDSDEAGSGCTMDERFFSPVIDATAGGPFTEVHLVFDHYFFWYSLSLDEQGEIAVRSSATSGWQVVANYSGASSPNPETVDIDISAEALNQTDLEVGFRYYNASYEMYWMVDNVQVCGVEAGGSSDVNCGAATVIACNSTNAGDTSAGGLANNANAYSCANDTYDGNEQVFEISIAEDTILEVILSNFGTSELDAFLLDSCSKCSCVAGGSDYFKYNISAGTYYIVVDGFSAADNGPFNLTVNCTSCVDPTMHNRWTSCENPRSPITTSTTSAFEWNFDDCDYCRDSGNTCFSTPCTFDMYIVAECGTEMHMPLYDNESGDLSIYDMTNGQYVYLYAQSTGGWLAEGTNIQWEDCGGLDPNWNDQTTDIWFYGSPTLCGIYRAEFVDWGGFIWDLYSNCTGTDTPGFKIYDNYCEALAAYDPYPALNVESMTISGSCPTYTVDYTISNAGCSEATTTVVAWSDLGGSTEEDVTVTPGATESGSLVVNIQNSGIGTIYAYADFYDYVKECQEAGDTATACSVSGGSSYQQSAINCGCAIPTFSTANVEDLSCPVGLRIFWNAATFNSGSGHYDIYRSSISFADAVSKPAIAEQVTTLEFIDNSVTQFINYWYVVRAEDDDPAPGGCTAGPHGGMYTDVNVGPITDNLPSSVVDKPYDIGNDLRAWKNPDGSVHLDWDNVVPAPETTHYHVYRTTDCTGIVPDDWNMICPDIPDPLALDDPINDQQYDDATATVANLYFYDIRSANDCETMCPDVLNINFTSNSPSCNGSGQIDFSAMVQGGIGPYDYVWEFGDGATCSTATMDCAPSDTDPSHTYTFPPYSRDVTLTVTDSTQPSNQQEAVVKIVKFGTGVTASFTSTPSGLQVTFDGTAGGGSGAYSYNWSFGDSSTSTLEDPVHTYGASGSYNVTFTVTDTQTGCQASSTDTLDL
ncbi:MAG TPA: PKD domain-containing protein [Thermoanaerobaculia bacterium]|nr:PKD domain-containing protein [Thermoanaerobaculia bacterium]HUM30759.1 PKD domain-containing protein [Thermoanaerobaculia bacterium]HXK69041.1 PKD domain-containing protein [Thermoanaerobaculia bacterium]